MATLSENALRNLNSPAKRHFASKINQNTLARRLNSVVVSSVDVDSDVDAIRSGAAKQSEGTFILTNGRVYGQHNGTLFPISGPGVYPLDRGSFKALGVLNQLGNTLQAQTILDRMGVNDETRSRALVVYTIDNPLQ